MQWLESDYMDEATKEELRQIAGDEKEIEERFYTELEFGTAGLRGIIGAGCNRMNEYTVRKGNTGDANYILKVGGQDRGVAIAYDSRHMSPEFADVAALCLAANGIKRHMCLNPFVQHRNYLMLYVNYIQLLVLILLQVIIHQSTMATKYIGKMVRRSHRHMTAAS